MTYAPMIDANHKAIREMVTTYLTDQLIRSSTRPTWFGAHIPDGKRFEYLVQRYYHRCSTEPQHEYQRYLCTTHWRIFRLAVMVAANGHCALCAKPADQVHHLTYERVGHEYLSDVVPLCAKCHQDQHEEKKR